MTEKWKILLGAWKRTELRRCRFSKRAGGTGKGGKEEGDGRDRGQRREGRAEGREEMADSGDDGRGIRERWRRTWWMNSSA